MGRSYSIKFKGTPQKEGSKFVKITMVFYRNGYNNRPYKVLNITGLIKEWDTKTELFKPNSSDNIDKNKQLLGIKQKYTRVVESWEENCIEWTPTQLATYFDIKKDSRSSQPIIQNVDKSIDNVIEMFKNRKKVKNGQTVSSIGNATAYENAKRTLTAFTLHKYNRPLSTFYFQEITENFISDYIVYLIERGAEKGKGGSVDTRLKKLYGMIYYSGEMNVIEFV